MTRLLISVRNAAEARVACENGADLIDVKEPSRGALGAADLDTVETVLKVVAGRLPVSVALDELPHAGSLDSRFAGRVRFAKFGLAGCRGVHDWVDRWQAAILGLPFGVTPVAVLYGDWQSAAAPAPREIVELARDVGCGAALIDTYDKSRGPLTSQIELAELRALVSAIARAGLISVVAGGLRLSDVAMAAALGADYVGVRGAACVGDRRGTLAGSLVAQLAEAVHQAAPMCETGT